jgi:glutaredoxin 3
MAYGESAHTQKVEDLMNVIMYSTGFCPYCVMAERMLRSRGVQEIEKIRVDLDPEKRTEMMERTGRRTVPQIFIGDTHVGGYDDLAKLDRSDALVKLLSA